MPSQCSTLAQIVRARVGLLAFAQQKKKSVRCAWALSELLQSGRTEAKVPLRLCAIEGETP
jgi:hypothetical protein